MKKISAQNMHDVANELRELLRDKRFAVAVLYTEEPDQWPMLSIFEQIDVDSDVRAEDCILVFLPGCMLTLRERDEYWFGIDEVYLQTAEERIVIQIM